MSPFGKLIYISLVYTPFSVNFRSHRSQRDKIQFLIGETTDPDSHRAGSPQGTTETSLVRQSDPVSVQEQTTCLASTIRDEHEACRNVGIERKAHMLKAMP